uniref:Uncharacterized protein n=1 Tax=Arundo donax TaxID=35708 RepID=A0A0A9BR64_ARUDO
MQGTCCFRWDRTYIPQTLDRYSM